MAMNGIKSIWETLQRAVGGWEAVGEEGRHHPGAFALKRIFVGADVIQR